MKTSTAVTIAGAVVGGGGLIGTAIKYSLPSSSSTDTPISSEEETTVQIKVAPKRVTKKITKEEAESYKTKFTTENCIVKIRSGNQKIEIKSHNLEGEDLDLDGLEQSWQEQNIKDKCLHGKVIEAEKEESGKWNFYEEIEALKLDIIKWAKENGNCTIRTNLKNKSTFQELNSIKSGDPWEEKLKALLSELKKSGTTKCSSGKYLDAEVSVVNLVLYQWSLSETNP